MDHMLSAHVRVMSALPPKADITERDWNVRFVPKADIGSGRVRLVKPTRWHERDVQHHQSGEVSASRVHLAVRLPRSHMMMSGGSDKSVAARDESSNHRRQQGVWLGNREGRRQSGF